MNTLTIQELQDQIEEICKKYDEGDETHYLIKNDNGEDCMLVPFDGPWTGTVEEDQEGFFVTLPQRLVAKMGWKMDDLIEIEELDGTLILKRSEL